MISDDRPATWADASAFFRELRETMDPLSRHQAMREGFTSRKVALEIPPSDYPPQRVREVRSLLEVSQALFASFLGVSRDTVRAWEGGKTSPSRIACRFMDEIRADPQHWRSRFLKLAARRVPCPRLHGHAGVSNGLGQSGSVE